jgi:hypothetical protein
MRREDCAQAGRWDSHPNSDRSSVAAVLPTADGAVASATGARRGRIRSEALAAVRSRPSWFQILTVFVASILATIGRSNPTRRSTNQSIFDWLLTTLTPRSKPHSKPAVTR